MNDRDIYLPINALNKAFLFWNISCQNYLVQIVRQESSTFIHYSQIKVFIYVVTPEQLNSHFPKSIITRDICYQIFKKGKGRHSNTSQFNLYILQTNPLPFSNCLLPIGHCQLQIANCQLLNDQKTSQSHLNSHTSLTPQNSILVNSLNLQSFLLSIF